MLQSNHLISMARVGRQKSPYSLVKRDIDTMYRNKRESRKDKRNALESAICEAVYQAGTLTISQIAGRVGRSKSPALRAVIADLCNDGRLVGKKIEDRSLGIWYFTVSHWWSVSRACQTSFDDDVWEKVG